MLFKNLLVIPSFRTIEFRDDGLSIFDSNLVNPVFIAVKGKVSPITQVTLSFYGIHDEIGSKGAERM